MKRLLGLIVFAMLGCSLAWCQEPTSELVVGNLNNPWGVAVQPSTGTVFVSESGAGRVFRWDEARIKEVIINFPVRPFELDKSLMMGPLGLTFNGRYELLVGCGGQDEEDDVVASFDLQSYELDSEQLAIRAKTMASSLSLPKQGDRVGEGDYFGLALGRKRLFTTCRGDEKMGWIGCAERGNGGFENFRRLLPASDLAGVAAPTAIALGPESHLVVALSGSRDTAGDSVLAFYSQDGRLLDKFDTGLSDIVALAYDSKFKKLYALDFSWHDPRQGGLYQLIGTDSEEGCIAKRLLQFDRPTAMAFGLTGELFVTTAGVPADGQDAADDSEELGKLWVVKGLE